MRTISLFFLCLLNVGAQPSLDGEKPVEVSLCEVLTSPGDYTGRIVLVSGTILANRDTYALQAKSCKTVLRTGQYLWTPAVCVRDKPMAPLTSIDQSLALFAETIKVYLVALWKGEIELSASFIGRIEARSEYRADPLAGGGYGTNGYCNMNLFPAILHVSRVTEWTIKIPQ